MVDAPRARHAPHSGYFGMSAPCTRSSHKPGSSHIFPARDLEADAGARETPSRGPENGHRGTPHPQEGAQRHIDRVYGAGPRAVAGTSTRAAPGTGHAVCPAGTAGARPATERTKSVMTAATSRWTVSFSRSEEHTSELQSH